MLRVILCVCLFAANEGIDWNQLENELENCENSSLCSNRDDSESPWCDCSDECWEFGTCCFDKVRNEMENSSVSLETLEKRRKWECVELASDDFPNKVRKYLFF